MRCRAVFAFGLLVVAACGARSNSAQLFRTAPNPNGCYAQLFAGEQFLGTGDYVNGPRRVPNVRDDPRWRNGVRSLRVGPSTIVRLWAEDNYRGSMVRITSDQHQASVSSALGEAAASLQISCN